MKLEQVKKPLIVAATEPRKNQAAALSTPVEARKPATSAQLQRAKIKLQQDQAAIQRQSERVVLQRSARLKPKVETRVKQIEQQPQIQPLVQTQTKQHFFSSFIKTPLQRKSLEGIKQSGMATSSLRAQYQAVIVPEIIQRLVSNQMQSQTSTAQTQNALNTRANWFNTDLPVLRARHNNPDQPDWDTQAVFKTSDARAQDLGKTYTAQRLASGLTPKDAANAILSIQRSQDRHQALKGMLSALNPRQSDYTNIQRLVAVGETKLELQRFALEEAVTPQALQLAKSQAYPTQADSGISQEIKAKLGTGVPIPENIRHQLETGLNTDLSWVRLHFDAQADKLAKLMHALAFTSGKDIFFQTNMYNPNTKTGYELIAHEVTHTVQQASGQVKPGIDSDLSLERDAQTKGAELAAKFDPNAKPKPQRIARSEIPNTSTGFSNVQRMAYSSLALQESKLAFQRQAAPNTRKIGNLEALERSAPMFGAPVQRSSDGTMIQRFSWNPLDWLKSMSNAAKSAMSWIGNKFMDGLEWMGEEAAKKFIEVFVVAARPFGEIGKQVLQGLQNIGSGLIAVIKDPSQFIRTLVNGAQLGLVNFFKNAPKHLSAAIGEFLGTQGLSFTFPRAFNAESILMAFVSSLGLGWSSIRAKIAKKLGPNGGQVMAQAEKTVPLIQEFAGGIGKSKTFKDQLLPVIQQEAVEGIKATAQETMIRSALNLLLKLVPGAGTISTIFDTVKFFVDRFQTVKNLTGNLLNAFKSVAAGNPVGVANAIEYSFANSMSIVLGLFAKITKIDGFLNKVRSIIKSVTSKINKFVDSIIEWAVKGLRPWVNKLGKPSSGQTIKPGSSKPAPAPSMVRTPQPASNKPAPTTAKPAAKQSLWQILKGKIVDPVSFIKNNISYKVWVESNNGKAKFMMNPTPVEAHVKINDYKTQMHSLKLETTMGGFVAQAENIVNTGTAEIEQKLITKGDTPTLAKLKADTKNIAKKYDNQLLKVYKKLDDAVTTNDPNAEITVDAMKAAVSSAGGIVAFMKKIAAGQTIAKIDRVKLGALWDHKTDGKSKHREALKDLFRAAMPERHEWIPSNFMLEVIDRDMDAHKIGQVPEWIDLQHKFRIKTKDLVFGANRVVVIDNQAVFQGHVGSKIFLQIIDQSSGDISEKEQFSNQAEFHDDLRGAFKASTEIVVVKEKIKDVISEWIWDGKSLPSLPLHKGLRWKGLGRSIDISSGAGLNEFKSNFNKVHITLTNSLKSL